MTKKKVVFVGAFKSTTRDGGTGGQTYACQSLVNSKISESIEWKKIDSTMVSFPPPSVQKRFALAAKRFRTFVKILGEDKEQDVFIMSSSGLSFVEKGTMALWAKNKGHFVVLGPRSGLLLDDFDSSSFMRRFIPLVLSRCDVVMCQGDSWKQRFKEKFGVTRSNLEVIPNWIDLNKYNAVRNYRANNENKKRKLRFLYLGRLEIYKGIFDLIQAVDKHQEQLQNAVFTVCGKGGKYDASIDMVRSLGMEALFDFRGWVVGEDKMTVLEESDVFVLPSHREGMPNVVLEAMASSLPVIATDVGGVPDIIKDETIGMVVPAKSPDALGKALVLMCQDSEKRKALGLKGYEHVKNHHDIETSCLKVGALFNRSCSTV